MADKTINDLTLSGLSASDHVPFQTGATAAGATKKVVASEILNSAPMAGLTLDLTQDYVFDDRANSLTLQGQSVGTEASLEIYTKDGDGTDDVHLRLIATGAPSDVSNAEYMDVEYDNASNSFLIYTQKTGSGTVRPLSLFTDGNAEQLYLDVAGNVGIGLVPTANMNGVSVEAGVITLKETTTPTSDVNYGKFYTKNDNNPYFQDGAGVEHTLITGSGVGIPIVLEAIHISPSKLSEINIHGGILSLAVAQPLNPTPTNIVVQKGIGKLLVVVNAGSDLDGDITITGESVDRNTGVSTPADTDTITIDALTTDNETSDGNGNVLHSLAGAYISNKWFTGSVTLSTADVTLTDVDVYHISFEQFNDQSGLTLDTFDVNLFSTATSAEFDAYLYLIKKQSGNKCDITREANLNLGADGETALVNKYWRLRRGNIAKAFDGATDGVWVEVFYSDTPNANIEDVSMKVWVTKS
jgi:hypothetical protein